jgi:methyltransferase family protein
MSWFSSPSSRDRKREQRAAPEAEPQVHRSLALAALLEEFRRSRKLQVLDLGPAVGSNVEFLSQFGCKIYIEDLFAALEARGAGEGNGGGEGAEAGPQFFADFLPTSESASFDVVLAWDTFNYLSRKELGYLIRHLSPFCHPGTLVFALISFQKQIPARPIRFRIVDPQKLAYEMRTTAVRPAPRFTPAEMNDLLRGFRVDRSFLLQHGIQEYLFVKEEGRAR